MGSTRLPGKALKPPPRQAACLAHHRPRGGELKFAIARYLPRRPIHETTRSRDFARAEGLDVVREPEEDDLVRRIAGAVRKTDADLVLKTGGDCPLVDPDIMRAMVETALREDADFVSNRVRWTFPLGLSCDVVSARAIHWCERNLGHPKERELFALYIREHPERFSVISHEHSEDLSHHSWTVDTAADYEFVSSIFDALYRENECFGLRDVLAHVASGESRSS